MPPTKTWKKRERSAAAMFGARRQRCSGSSGRDDCSRSDSTHDRLFIETKHRQSHAVVTLYDQTRGFARKEGKTPVVILSQHGRKGLLIVIDPNDLEAVAAEWKAAREGETSDADPARE